MGLAAPIPVDPSSFPAWCSALKEPAWMLCSRVQNQLSAYADRELTGAEMLAIQGHLARCSECRQEYDCLLQIRRLMGALSNVERPRPFGTDFLACPTRHRPRGVRGHAMHA